MFFLLFVTKHVTFFPRFIGLTLKVNLHIIFYLLDLYQHLSWQFMNLKRCITIEDLKHRLGLGEDKLTKFQELFAGSVCKDKITKDGFSHWMVNESFSNAFRLWSLISTWSQNLELIFSQKLTTSNKPDTTHTPLWSELEFIN